MNIRVNCFLNAVFKLENKKKYFVLENKKKIFRCVEVLN
jgi:hypothetical protein